MCVDTTYVVTTGKTQWKAAEENQLHMQPVLDHILYVKPGYSAQLNHG